MEDELTEELLELTEELFELADELLELTEELLELTEELLELAEELLVLTEELFELADELLELTEELFEFAEELLEGLDTSADVFCFLHPEKQKTRKMDKTKHITLFILILLFIIYSIFYKQFVALIPKVNRQVNVISMRFFKTLNFIPKITNLFGAVS